MMTQQEVNLNSPAHTLATRLTEAYVWLCAQRRQRSANNSVWDLRFRWQQLQPQLQEQLRNGRYRLSPVQSYFIQGQWVSSWCATDALVLKALALSLQAWFGREAYPRCTHIKGDDWVVMVKTKQQLRKVVKITHKVLGELKLKMHPDKTYIGRLKKGFDFLGVRFGTVPRMAKTSLERHRAKVAQRYAQGASSTALGDYVARWTRWCESVLQSSGWPNHNNTTNLREPKRLVVQGSLGSGNKEGGDGQVAMERVDARRC